MPTISTDCLLPCVLHLALFRFVTTIPFVQQVTKNRATNELKFPAPWAGESGGNVNLRINAWNGEVCFCAALLTRTLQSRQVDFICCKAHMHRVAVFPCISQREQVGSSYNASYF
jgi:hypothetical protein